MGRVGFSCVHFTYMSTYMYVVAMSLGQILITQTLVNCVGDIVWPPYVFEKKIQLDEGRPAVPAWPKAPSEICKKALI